ncbi:MAG: hypothetical protein WA434_04930 [Candidatus Acidiferrales bacterium]
MWIKNKCLRAFLMLPLAMLPMHAKDIEEILHVMNEAKAEFTIPDENNKGDGKWPPIEIELPQPVVDCDEARESSDPRGSANASARSS